ncbi:hypothetical protein IQ07DRAFT_147221 [Pyrenochaeta sp. DS3sAY3a]|nr:hypothetical protein IQ07DRAFT_147221 [Pyrenochaeta sp. DS3sAY3a]
MDLLPTELWIQIASHLDTEPPSIVKFDHEPSPQLTHADVTPLKTLSCVSWPWRKVVLPLLFRYSQIALDSEPQWVAMDARLIENMQAQLTSLSSHELFVYQKMLNKVKSMSLEYAYHASYDDSLINLCRVQDGDAFLQTVPNMFWLPHLPKSFSAFTTFVAHHRLKRHVRSVVVHTEKEYELRYVATAEAPLAQLVKDIWTQIFTHLEPLRVVVAAPPVTLAGLLDTQMLWTDAWAFDMKTHYIELLQADPPRLSHMGTPCRPWDWALIHRRPWYHVGYNEGSSITAYSTYEYHLMQSPKMLYLVLVRLAKEASPCCNISSFSFTGVFPFASNITTLIRALHRIPTLDCIKVRFAPGPENKLLGEPKRMGRAQAGDCWLEWRESYKVIASYLGVNDFNDGATFESRDCEIVGLADEVEESMDLLRKRGDGWEKVGVGMWRRDHGLDGEVVADAIAS